jgi:V/A-type H+-transporting ATPase subunit K
MEVDGLRYGGTVSAIPLLVLVLALSIPSVVGYAEEGEAIRIIAKAAGAALAVGLAGLGAGYAVGTAGAAAASGIVEKREVTGLLLLIVVLGEGIAIYGLLIALLVILLL